MSDTIVVALGPAAAADAAAAATAGAYGTRSRLVLLVVDTADVPELSTPVVGTPTFEAVAQCFERVLTLNDLIFPEHPRAWKPGRTARAAFRRHLLARAGLGSDTRLALPSDDAPVLETIASTFTRSHLVPAPAAAATGELAAAAARLAEIEAHDARIQASLAFPALGADADPSPWERLGLPAPVARLLPRGWFEPLREWSRIRLAPLVVRWRRSRQDFAAVDLPDLTAEDISRDRPR